MPNQLFIPFKKTYVIPVREAVRDYILTHHTDTHPDAYRWDVGRWETLRAEAVSSVVHVDRVKALISYHAQLVFILTKLPANIGLEIPYAPAFSSAALPETYTNLIYERAGILFNIAALYSQLASSEDRSTPHGLKQAIKFYQCAAGTLSYLSSTVSPLLQNSLAPEEPPSELSSSFTRALEQLMLAQAQECVWQRAVMDNYKNGLIAKLAAKVASFYGTVVSQMKDNTATNDILPTSWVAHVETKHFHFQAAAQYRKSLEDLETNRYGHEVARLSEASSLAKRGYDIARRGGAALPVQQDIKSLLDIVQKNISRAERDNDLIYHQDVPPASALPLIPEVSMAQLLVDPGLQDPKTVIGQDGVVFGELLGWGARLAIEIYKDRRQNWITEEITERVRRLDDTIASTLESLSLPSALDAVDKPIGLPPSILKKAEEVKLDSGPERIETSINDVQALAKHNATLLDEAMDTLDQEADEDENFRESHPDTERALSHEANRELIEKEQRYRAILQQAQDSDEVVRQKWEEWEENIIQLTWTEDELESSIPSSSNINTTSQPTGLDPTRVHVRALRALLEKLDDLSKDRAELNARVARLAATDDITPRVLKAASGMEQWVNVQPAMFEDILDEELSKFEKFRAQLDDDEQRQTELLQVVQERQGKFLESRKEDPTVHAREMALQAMDLAYHKYKEIVRNLEEGLKFYNELAVLLSQFRDTCKDWVTLRRHELSSITSALESMSISPPDNTPAQHVQTSPISPVAAQRSAVSPEPLRAVSPPPPPERRARGAVLDLPPPDSDEWETMAMPPPPPKNPKKAASRRR